MRDIAEVLDITERSVQKIITRLESSGILERSREGRANRYHLHLDKNLPHLREEPYPLRALCDLILNR